MEDYYDLRNNPYYSNKDIESFEYLEIRHENRDRSNPSEDANYNFYINNTHDNLLLSKAYVHLEVKIVKENGDSIGNDNVTFINGVRFIYNSKLIIGDREIESHTSNEEIKHHVMDLIHFTPDYLTSNNYCFYLDTVDSADTKKLKYNGVLTDATKIPEFFNNLQLNDKYNQGFDKRREFTKDSKILKIWYPLNKVFNFFEFYEKVITGFPIKIELQRNKSKNMIYTDVANPDYKVVIENLTIWTPIVKFKGSALTKFESMKLSENPIEINWDQYNIKKSNTFHKNGSGSCSVITSSNEVLSLIVVPQYVERNDNPNKNNLFFDNLDMRSCWLSISGIPCFPTIPYKMDFKNKNWNRIYYEYFKAGFERGSILSYSDFEKYPILCFNLSHHEEYSNLSNLEIEFHFELRNNTDKDYHFYFILKERKRGFINMLKKEIIMKNTLKI